MATAGADEGLGVSFVTQAKLLEQQVRVREPPSPIGQRLQSRGSEVSRELTDGFARRRLGTHRPCCRAPRALRR